MSEPPNYEKFVWTADFSVGVGALDRQHKSIIDTINTLASCKGSPSEAEVVSESLTSLIFHAKMHFTDEEHFMKRHGFLELDAHHKLHRDFLIKIVDFGTATEVLVPDLADRLRAYLIDWWSQHILVEDMKIKEFAQEKRTPNVGA
jgi:hemerythrin